MPERETTPAAPGWNICRRHDAGAAAAGVMRPGPFGPTSRAPRRGEVRRDLRHVAHRDALGDADDEPDAGVGRLDHGVAGEAAPARRARRRPAPVCATASRTRVEDGDALDVWPPVPGRDAGDDVGAGGAHARGVKGALAPGDALDEDAAGSCRRGWPSALASGRSPTPVRGASRAAVDDQPHGLPGASATVTPARRASARTARPSSAALPSRRTTTGASTPAAPRSPR